MTAEKLFDRIAQSPGVQPLARRVEEGGALSCPGVSAPAQPFLAALLRRLFPDRPILIVTDSLKSQEWFQQDVETWLRMAEMENPQPPRQASEQPRPLPQENAFDEGPPAGKAGAVTRPTLFYPAWEILPHETKLPHSDVIAERLETLLALARERGNTATAHPFIVTSITALLQRTYSPEQLARRVRTLQRGYQTTSLRRAA